jgi:hypothetical protein
MFPRALTSLAAEVHRPGGWEDPTRAIRDAVVCVFDHMQRLHYPLTGSNATVLFWQTRKKRATSSRLRQTLPLTSRSTDRLDAVSCLTEAAYISPRTGCPGNRDAIRVQARLGSITEPW